MRNYKQYSLPERRIVGGEKAEISFDASDLYDSSLTLDDSVQIKFSLISYQNRHCSSPIITMGSDPIYEDTTYPESTIWYSGSPAWVPVSNDTAGYGLVFDDIAAGCCNTAHMQNGVTYKLTIATEVFESVYVSQEQTVTISGTPYISIGYFDVSSGEYTVYVIGDKGFIITSFSDVDGQTLRFVVANAEDLTITSLVDSGENISYFTESNTVVITLSEAKTRKLSGKYIYQVTIISMYGEGVKQGVLFVDGNIESFYEETVLDRSISVPAEDLEEVVAAQIARALLSYYNCSEVDNLLADLKLDYYSKKEIDNMSYITPEDIDEVCGQIIHIADETSF